MILCYITDRLGFPAARRSKAWRSSGRIDAAARAGVDYIQLREKDLVPRHLESWHARSRTRYGIIRHHTAADQRPRRHCPGHRRRRRTFTLGRSGPLRSARSLDAAVDASPHRSVAAHSSADVRYAEAHGADFAVLAPVFEKAGARRTESARLAFAQPASIQPFRTTARLRRRRAVFPCLPWAALP